MKKILKAGVVVAGVAAIGFLAYKGFKKLMEKADLDCCGCGEGCTCGRNHEGGECHCGCDEHKHVEGCTCECHGNDEGVVEVVVEEKEVEKVEEPVAPEANAEAPVAE